MGSYQAADFIYLVESNFRINAISADERKILLRDISDIVEKLNENSNAKKVLIRGEKPFSSSLYVYNGIYRRTYKEGHLVSDNYFEEGTNEPGRDNDKPAITTYHKNRNIEKEVWYSHNRINRSGDEPAILEYYLNGKLKLKQWRIFGEIHRETNGPVSLEYYENGNLKYIQHNTKGFTEVEKFTKPARVFYKENGTVDREEYLLKY